MFQANDLPPKPNPIEANTTFARMTKTPTRIVQPSLHSLIHLRAHELDFRVRLCLKSLEVLDFRP